MSEPETDETAAEAPKPAAEAPAAAAPPVPEAPAATAPPVPEPPAAAPPSAVEAPAAAAPPAAVVPAAAPAAAPAAEAAKPAAKPKPAPKPKKEELTTPEREPDADLKALAVAHPDKVLQVYNRYHEHNIVASREGYHALCQVLRDDPGLRFDYLALLTGLHFQGAEERFEVILELYSMQFNRRLRVKVKLDPQAPVVDTVCDIWPTANWHEREAFDMFGIRFSGHPDLRRILMPDYWTGYPLRKDYPWRGYRDKDEAKLHERIASMPLILDEFPKVLP